MRNRKARFFLGITSAAVLLVGCSSSSGSSSGSGKVDVLYAGSLVNLVTKDLGPDFANATSYSVSGFPGGSTDLAAEIKGKTQKADVFLSASPAADALLQGKKNGDWVSWYASFAKAPLVLAYNPKSKFAAQLTSKPWYDVVTEKGFRLGKTDPATDPKGVLAAEALTDVGKAKNLPALTALAKSQAGVYPEQTLVGRLQAGQLDAGFFYTSEAAAANLKTVPLTGTNFFATYTVTVVNHAPNQKGAVAFVKYLLSAKGKATLKQNGCELIPITVSGSGVPSELSSVLPSK